MHSDGNKDIVNAIKSWPVTILSQEGGGLFFQLFRHVTVVVNPVRPSQVNSASLLITAEGSFSSDFGPFSGFENWSSQWLSRRNQDF